MNSPAKTPRPLLEPLESRRLLTGLLGIDVSYFQGSAQTPPTQINWPAVKATGETFAYVRSDWGASGLSWSGVDADFTRNATQALSAGLYVGYYHYAYYDKTGHTAINEADHYWSTIAPYMAADGKHLMPFLDVEEGTVVDDGQTLSAWVDNFCLEFQKKAAAAGFSIVPLVYISASPAGTYFDTAPNVPSPVTLYPADIAQYPNTNTYTPSDPPPASAPSGTGDWQTWAMWQYSSHGSVSGITGNVDMDVFNGDLNNLKDYFVQAWAVGAQVTAHPQPSFYSAANALPTSVKVYANSTGHATDAFTPVPAYTGGTIIAKGATKDADGNQRWQVTFANGVTGWIVQDANYLVRNLSGRYPTGSWVTARTVTGQTLQGPIYANGVQRYQVQFNNGVTGWYDEELLTTATPSVASPSPANSTSAWLASLPASFTWSGTNASSYDVYLDGTLKASGLTAPSWTHAPIADGAHTWYVVSHNAELSTTGATWTFKIDTVAPTATYGNESPAAGAGSLSFTVTYADATSGLQAASLASAGAVLVTGPNGYSQSPTSASVSGNVVTYTLPAPGGSWEVADNGTYTLSQVASTIRDVAGNYRPVDTLGTFSLTIPAATLAAGTLTVDVASTHAVQLASDGATLSVTQATTTSSFPLSSITQILINGTTADDTITLAGPITPPITPSGNGGSDSLTLNSGASATLAADAAGFAISVNSAASLTLAASQHLSTLAITGGTVTVPSDGTTPLVFSDLSISSGGVLDLYNNPAIWDYTDSPPIPTLRQYLRAGYNGGAWNGTDGIRSASAANATAGSNPALAYADAAHVGLSSFANNSLDSTALVIQYGPAGDANLDGRIDADDYALTDRGALLPLTSRATWTQGDFNYDGAVDASDYAAIDASALLAGGSTTAPAALLSTRQSQFGPAYTAALTAILSPTTTATTPTPAPVAKLTAPKSARHGKPTPFRLSVPAAKKGSTFTYQIDWNGDGVTDQTLTARPASVLLKRAFAKPGKRKITLRVTDDSTGLTSDPITVTLRVT